MNIVIASDHNGFELKSKLINWLQSEGHTIEDLGAMEFEKADDYPDFGIAVGKAVHDNLESRGIVICGSGVGMAVAANKVQGVRAALIHDPEIATASQRDDDINVLALGASYISFEEAQKIITNWLTTPFSGEERHIRRIQKISEYESR